MAYKRIIIKNDPQVLSELEKIRKYMDKENIKISDLKSKGLFKFIRVYYMGTYNNNTGKLGPCTAPMSTVEKFGKVLKEWKK